MRLKNAIKLIFANFGATFKVLLYKLIVFAVLVLVGVFVLLPNFQYLIEASSLDKLVASLGDLLKAIFVPDMVFGEEQQAFAAYLSEFTAYVSGNIGKIAGLGGALAAFYFVGMFFNNIADFALGQVVNDYMSSLTETSFTVGIFKNLGRASLYSLIDVAVSLAFMSAAVSLCLFIIWVSPAGIVTMFFAVLVFVVLISLKQVFASDFMPNIVADKIPAAKAFRESVKVPRKDFMRKFNNYLSINIIMLYVNVTAGLFTVMTGLLLTFPLTTLILICFRFVSQYTTTGKKYYLAPEEIVKPPRVSEDDEDDILKKIDEE
ncbi:MAG: hypothetical protein DBX59_11115 [Bacillota bacterium]|nr:MAG: hypothetical protein DBX59_11115 [Bacillota bacterium]